MVLGAIDHAPAIEPRVADRTIEKPEVGRHPVGAGHVEGTRGRAGHIGYGSGEWPHRAPCPVRKGGLGDLGVLDAAEAGERMHRGIVGDHGGDNLGRIHGVGLRRGFGQLGKPGIEHTGCFD